MLNDEILTIENPPQETYWIGDPAIDLENSNVNQWIIDGTGLIPKPKQEASLITYRGLTPFEMVELETMTTGDRRNLQFYEACRFGLIDIKGIELKWSYSPKRILSDESFDKLLHKDLVHEIQLEQFIYNVYIARGYEANKPKGNNTHPTQLPFFIGGLILARSFR